MTRAALPSRLRVLPSLFMCCACSNAASPASAPPLTASIGPFVAKAGADVAFCTEVELGNAEPVFVSRITGTVSGAHHLVAYRAGASGETTTGECALGAVPKDTDHAPLATVAHSNSVWTLPPLASLQLAPHQRIRLEAHCTNPGIEDLRCDGSVEFHTGAAEGEGRARVPADVTWSGTAQEVLSPAPRAPHFFAPMEAGKRLFALMPDAQSRADLMVWFSARDGAPPGAPLLEHRVASEALLVAVDPPIESDGSTGIAYQCTLPDGQSPAASATTCGVYVYSY